MKPISLILPCLVLVIAALFAGCSSSASDNVVTTPAKTPTPAPPPANITYEKHGLSFIYPDNLVLTEHDASEGNAGSWESGDVNLKGGSDNITISWIAMHHRPPDIPIVYESMRSSFQKNPTMSNVKFFLLETYPATTCGSATMIGHAGFYDRIRKVQTYEGLILWYHPKQDRTYLIDIASGNEYKPYIYDMLSGYQQSFRCVVP